MKLTTIADLDQPMSVKAPLIERAMQLGKWYTEFKATDTEAYSYSIDVYGERDRSPGIHASEISNCKRLLVYSIMATERRPVSMADTDVNMRMRFSLGHAVHAMIQSEMHRMAARFQGALIFEDEVRISPELGGPAAQWGMHSSCDGVFSFVHEGQVYLRVGFEIKTASDGEFGKLVKPKEDHMQQTCLYQRALDLPLMWIFYYNKSNSNWTPSESPYLFQFDKTLWSKKLEPRFRRATEMAKAGELPPREEGRHCRWCPFAWTCQPPSLLRRDRGPRTTAYKPGALRTR